MTTTPTYEKHTTHTDALDTLGSVIDESQKRDAIHLAVIPATANERLLPGDHVSYDETGLSERTKVGEGVGIVDPFLIEALRPGDRFWLVVYPRQISSLRHVWEHPAFPPSGETEPVAEPSPGITRADSEEWLRQLAVRAAGGLDDGADGDGWDRYTFDCFIRDLQNGDGEYVVLHGRDNDISSIPHETWLHLSNYLGREVAPRATHFSCTC